MDRNYKAAENPNLESPPKKWLMTMQLSYKIIEACYNLRDGDQHEILDTIFDCIFISRKEDKIAIDLKDSASIILNKTWPQTHSFVDIGYSTDYWIRNRKTVDVKPSESTDNFIKSINLERVENVSSGDENLNCMSQIDCDEESDTECEDNAAYKTEQVSFCDNQGVAKRSMSLKQDVVENENSNENNQRTSKHVTQDATGRRMSLRQGPEINDEGITENNQRRTPRRVSKGVSYCEDNILFEKNEETDDNVFDGDNDDENYVPTGIESAEEYKYPRKRRKKEFNIHDIKYKNSPRAKKFHYCVCNFRSADYVKLSEHKAICAKIKKEIDDNINGDSNDETYVPDGEEDAVESKRKCGKAQKESDDGDTLYICMIKAECPICETWYKYSRTGILRHLKISHLDIPNQFEEQLREEMHHHKPSEDERVKCDICQMELDQSFAPLHIQYEHSERKYAQSQIALAKYYNLQCNLSQPFATKTAKYNFNLSFEKLTSKIEIAVCKLCNLQFTPKQLKRHQRKCEKNLDYINDDDDSYDETDGEENAEECKRKGKKTHKESIDRDNMLNVYMIKAECPICQSWYKYARVGILRHLKICHLDFPNQYEEQFKEEMRHHQPSEDERVKCDICQIEVDQSFAPLHVQYEHSERKYAQSQIALAKYYNLRCKSSQPLATKTAKYNFNLSFEKQTNKIEIVVCKVCNMQFTLKQMETHHMKCKNNPAYKNDDDSYDETDISNGEENTVESKWKSGKTHKESIDRVNMLNVYMIKAECPICQSWYKYARVGILRHFKLNHLDIPNQYEEQFREEMRHYQPSEDERVKCDICQIEVDHSFAPLHIQYEHSERKYPQSQIALAKYYKLRCKSSEPLATKTAKYNFNLLFEKLTNKIEVAVCKFCNKQFTLKQMETHPRKCEKKKQIYCECGYSSIEYDKLSQHKAICTKKRRQSDDEDGDEDKVDVVDDSDIDYKPGGDENQDKFEESEDLTTMAEGIQVKSEPLDVIEKIKVVKARRKNMLNVYVIKTKCPICESWYKYSRLGIIKHLQVNHSEAPNQGDFLTMFKEEIRHYKATENEKVICDLCDLELDQSFAPLHIQYEHSENMSVQSQIALDKYYNLRCKSSQPLATKTVKYNLHLLFEKLTNKIEIAVCKFCGETFSVKKMEQHHLKCKKNPGKRKRHFCVCGFKSVDITRMKEHKTTCNYKPRNVVCDYCGIHCKSTSAYYSHRKFFHGVQTKRTTAVKDYPCDQCDKVYHLPSRLQKHINSTHCKSKPYICEICARAYSYEAGLKRHIEFAHHNIYNYYCEKCGHGMNKKALVKTHVCGRVRRRKKRHEIYWTHLENDNETFKPTPNKYKQFKELPAKVNKPPAAAAVSSSKQEASGSYEPYLMNIDVQSDHSAGFVETSNQSEVIYRNHQDQKEIPFDNQRKETLFENTQGSLTQQSLVMGTAGIPHENMYLPMQNPYNNMVEPRNYSSFHMNQ